MNICFGHIASTIYLSSRSVDPGSLLFMFACLTGFVIAVLRPRWLLYILVFSLLEPSRHLSLGNVVVGGTINIKFYEIMLLLFFIGAFLNRKRSISSCVFPSLVVFLLCVLFSLGNGLLQGYGEGAFNHFRSFLSMGMLIAVPLLYRDPDELKPFFLFFFIISVFVGAAELAEMYHVNPFSAWIQSGDRANYSSMMSATTGSFLAMSYLYGVCTIRYARFRLLAVTAILWCLLAAVLTGVRSVWLGLLASTAGLITLLELRRKITLILLLAAIGLVVGYIGSEFYIERYDTSLLERMKITFNPEEGNARWRIQIWSQMIDDITCHPVLGWPMGSVPRFYISGHQEAVAPHNEYLKIARYTGLIGLAAFFWLLASIIFPALQYLHRRNYSRQYYEMLGLILCFGYHVITSFFTQRFTAIDISPVVWLIPGIMFIYLLNDTDTADSPVPITAEASGELTD
jgi:hypothetical protein